MAKLGVELLSSQFKYSAVDLDIGTVPCLGIVTGSVVIPYSFKLNIYRKLSLVML